MILYVEGHSNSFDPIFLFSGENPAAMQTGTSHRMQSTAPLFWVFLLLTTTQYLLHQAHMVNLEQAFRWMN